MTAAWLASAAHSAALSFDTETTGVDTATDRIVTAAALEVSALGVPVRCIWTVNPGVEIPAAAAAIHGVSTDYARAHGLPAAEAVRAIADVLRRGWANGLPLIACNASFDLSLMQAELARYELPPLEVGPVLDPLVIDRGADPYRKGKRTLTALAQHYGVKLGEAHSAEGDALTAARIIWAQARKLSDLANLSLEQMQGWQREAHAAWAKNFTAYLAKQGKPEAIDPSWPVRRAA